MPLTGNELKRPLCRDRSGLSEHTQPCPAESFSLSLPTLEFSAVPTHQIPPQSDIFLTLETSYTTMSCYHAMNFQKCFLTSFAPIWSHGAVLTLYIIPVSISHNGILYLNGLHHPHRPRVLWTTLLYPSEASKPWEELGGGLQKGADCFTFVQGRRRGR